MYVPSGKYKILIVGINLDNTGPNSCFETFYLKLHSYFFNNIFLWTRVDSDLTRILLGHHGQLE